MIELTRLNGNRLAVNSDLIQFAESSPDTLLTMVTGEKLIVSESLTEIADRMAASRARILAEAARISPGALMLTSGAALRALAFGNAAESSVESHALDEENTIRMRRRRRAEL
jgi:flagellar protein FlbD